MKAEDTGGQEGREKEREIIVNGRPKVVTEKEICFEALLELAFDPVPTGEFMVFTVTYHKGHADHGKGGGGTLLPGECVKVKNRMVFNVTATDKS